MIKIINDRFTSAFPFQMCLIDRLEILMIHLYDKSKKDIMEIQIYLTFPLICSALGPWQQN